MLHWIATTVGNFSYLGVAILMAIENVILPLPSEIIMPFAGARTNHGAMTLWGVILAGTIGSVVGSYPAFVAAWIFGPERVMAWADAHGKWLLLRRGDLQKAHDRFENKGASAVFLSQLVPGVRGLIAIPAGFAHMNVLLFTIANFAGTLIWCSILAVLGHELGVHFDRINKYFGPVGWLVLIGAVIGVPIWLYRRKRRRGARASG